MEIFVSERAAQQYLYGKVASKHRNSSTILRHASSPLLPRIQRLGLKEKINSAYQSYREGISEEHRDLLEKIASLASNRGYSHARRVEKINDLLYSHINPFSEAEREFCARVSSITDEYIVKKARKGKIKRAGYVVRELRKMRRGLEDDGLPEMASNVLHLPAAKNLETAIYEQQQPVDGLPMYMGGKRVSVEDITNMLVAMPRRTPQPSDDGDVFLPVIRDASRPSPYNRWMRPLKIAASVVLAAAGIYFFSNYSEIRESRGGIEPAAHPAIFQPPSHKEESDGLIAHVNKAQKYYRGPF